MKNFILLYTVKNENASVFGLGMFGETRPCSNHRAVTSRQSCGEKADTLVGSRTKKAFGNFKQGRSVGATHNSVRSSRPHLFLLRWRMKHQPIGPKVLWSSRSKYLNSKFWNHARASNVIWVFFGLVKTCLGYDFRFVTRHSSPWDDHYFDSSSWPQVLKSVLLPKNKVNCITIFTSILHLRRIW